MNKERRAPWASLGHAAPVGRRYEAGQPLCWVCWWHHALTCPDRCLCLPQGEVGAPGEPGEPVRSCVCASATPVQGRSRPWSCCVLSHRASLAVMASPGPGETRGTWDPWACVASRWVGFSGCQHSPVLAWHGSDFPSLQGERGMKGACGLNGDKGDKVSGCLQGAAGAWMLPGGCGPSEPLHQPGERGDG